jgi:hypothetical protein
MAGLSVRTEANGMPSEASRHLLEIVRSIGIDWVGPLAGYGAGLQSFGDYRILVSRPLKLIKPEPGDWTTTGDIIEGMFGSQMQHVLATLKYGYEAHRDDSDRPVPMITMCGPASGDSKETCAWKSAFAKRVIGLVWGGRMADASRYLMGRTEFNADLCGSEVLLLDDVKPYGNWLSRHDLSEHLKNIIVGAVQSLHAKGKDAIPLRPHWRVVMTLNDDDDALRQMPDFSRNFGDKTHFFKVSEFELPMPNRTPAEWAALDAKIASELPGFIHDLLEWDVPQEIRSDRFGVKAYHHPGLLEQLYQMSAEAQLGELIRAWMDGMGNVKWTGSATELKAELCRNFNYGKEAEKLLSFSNATGSLLGRLQKREPEKYTSKRIGKSRDRVWDIQLKATTIDHHATTIGK